MLRLFFTLVGFTTRSYQLGVLHDKRQRLSRFLVLKRLAQTQWATPPPPPAGYWISCLLSCYEVLPQRRFAKDWQTLLWGVAFAGVSSGLFSLRLFSGDWRTATLGETCRQLLHSAPDGVWRTPCSCAQIFEDDLVGDVLLYGIHLTLWYLSFFRIIYSQTIVTTYNYVVFPRQPLWRRFNKDFTVLNQTISSRVIGKCLWLLNGWSDLER